MKRQILLLITLLITVIYFLCKPTALSDTVTSPPRSRITKVVQLANSYLNTPYKAGGTSARGFDCSGLIYRCFQREGIELPRSSKAMSSAGTLVQRMDIKVGDLVFFTIRRLGNAINHVGIVSTTDNGDVQFIHSSTKNGVCVNSLNEPYWNNNFVIAKRITP